MQFWNLENLEEVCLRERDGEAIHVPSGLTITALSPQNARPTTKPAPTTKQEQLTGRTEDGIALALHDWVLWLTWLEVTPHIFTADVENGGIMVA